MSVFIIWLDDYADPVPMEGPFGSKEEALLSYLEGLRREDPGDWDADPGETDFHAACRFYLTDDRVRLGRTA